MTESKAAKRQVRLKGKPEDMNKFKALLIMGRIPFCLEASHGFLRASIVGSLAYSYDNGVALSWTRALLSGSIAALTNVGLNYLNDYMDLPGDLYEYNKAKAEAARKGGDYKLPTKGSGILVRGILPRWTALAAALAVWTLVFSIILGHRASYPDTTPFQGQVLLATLIAFFVSCAYNTPPFNTSYTPLCELTSLSTLCFGSFLCGYNFQDSSGGMVFSFPTSTMPLLVLDVLLEAPRLLTMNIVDIEADLTIKKRTFAGILGYTASAHLYKSFVYIFTFTALALSKYNSDRYISRITLCTALLVVPQMVAVSRQLQRLALKRRKEGDAPDIWVSVLEIQKLLLWFGFLALGRS